jgi:hypothetical protein
MSFGAPLMTNSSRNARPFPSHVQRAKFVPWLEVLDKTHEPHYFEIDIKGSSFVSIMSVIRDNPACVYIIENMKMHKFGTAMYLDLNVAGISILNDLHPDVYNDVISIIDFYENPGVMGVPRLKLQLESRLNKGRVLYSRQCMNPSLLEYIKTQIPNIEKDLIGAYASHLSLNQAAICILETDRKFICWSNITRNENAAHIILNNIDKITDLRSIHMNKNLKTLMKNKRIREHIKKLDTNELLGNIKSSYHLVRISEKTNLVISMKTEFNEYKIHRDKHPDYNIGLGLVPTY